MEAGDSAAVAAALVVAIEFLKNSKMFPWLTPECTERYKKGFSVALATMAALGFHLAVDVDARSLTFTWPTLYEFAHGLQEWGSTVGFTELFYRLIKQQKPAPPVAISG